MHKQLPALNTAEFAVVARALAAESRRLGLVAPGFRCPPRIVGVDRTLRRFDGDENAGGVAGIVAGIVAVAVKGRPLAAVVADMIEGIVAVAVKGRPLAAVVADMIEGVVTLNRLAAAEAARIRAALWQSLDTAASIADAPTSAARDAHHSAAHDAHVA